MAGSDTVDTGGGISALTFGTGASGLAPPTISYGSIDLKPLMTAMQQRMKNAQNARENEIALQQLAMREKLAQDEMQLKRDQFAAEGPLRAAQIENYHALANYHNRMGKAQSDAITKEWQYNASLVPQLSNYSTAMNDLSKKYDVGSEDWWTARNALENEYTDVLATQPGMRLQGIYDQRGTRASTAIGQAQLRTAASLNNVVEKYQIPLTAINDLQQSVDRPTQFVASAGGFTSGAWGKNQDGSRYAYFPYDPNGKVDPKLPPVPLADVTAADPEDVKRNYRKVTIDAPQLEPILSAARALSGPLRGNGTAPPWAYSLRGKATEGIKKRRYDPGSGKYIDVTQ